MKNLLESKTCRKSTTPPSHWIVFHCYQAFIDATESTTEESLIIVI